MFAVAGHLDAGDERVAVSGGALDEALAAGRQIMDQFRPSQAEGVEIDDIDVGLVARRQQWCSEKAVARRAAKRRAAKQKGSVRV